MVLKKSELEILEEYRKNIFLSITIRALALKLKRHYPNTYNAVKSLVDKNILKIKKTGKSTLCELSFSPESMPFLAFLEEHRAFLRDVPHIKNKILNFPEFMNDIVIVFGSYASGKQTTKSDIDVVIITYNKAFEKTKLFENYTSLFRPPVHPIVISQKDFISMLNEKAASFGKEIFFNHLIYRNAERYFTLLKEAIDNGFRG